MSNRKITSSGYCPIDTMGRRESIIRLPLRLMNPKLSTAKEVQQCSENRLGQLFFSLPTELQVQTICHFHLITEVLALRCVSRSFEALLNRNAYAITHAMMGRSQLGITEDLWMKLYPFPQPMNDLSYLAVTQHRQEIITGATQVVGDFVQDKIYRIKSNARRREQFAPKRRSMEEHFRQPMLLLLHFFERSFHEIAPYINLPDEVQPISVTVKRANCPEQYPLEALIPAFQLCRIFFSVYRQKLRPPSYAGSFERKFRGWDRAPATQTEMSKIVVFGGLEAMYTIIRRPKYTERIDAMHEFINGLQAEIRSSHGSITSVGSQNLSAADGSAIDPLTVTYSLEPLALQSAIFLGAARRRILDEGLVSQVSEIQDPYAYIENTFFQGQNFQDDESLDSAES